MLTLGAAAPGGAATLDPTAKETADGAYAVEVLAVGELLGMRRFNVEMVEENNTEEE